jgi:hypothetical protein
VLSFNKFAQICLDEKLFSQEKQSLFAEKVEIHV